MKNFFKVPRPGAMHLNTSRARRVEPALFPLILFAINIYFCKELFTLEYSQFMGSIEAAYISISHYMLENWRDLTWFPLWYGGIPFQNTYPPFLHAVVALTAISFRISPALAHHAVTAFLYCAGPVALYCLALRMTHSRWYSFWASLAYSILSPSAFLMPSVHADLGTLLAPRRFQALVIWGEGPHITSLALLPVALLCLDLALSKRRPFWYLLAASSMAAVALSNWLGAAALAMAVLAYLLAGLGSTRRTLGIALLAYALACPWIPPSTIRAIRYNAQFVGDFHGVYHRLPLYAALGIAAAALLKYAMHRFKVSRQLQFFLLFAFFTCAITLSADWFGVLVVPQPLRYHLEMELAVCLAAAFACKALIDRLSHPYKTAIACGLLLLCYFPIRQDRQYARRRLKPVDIAGTIEYKEAKWLDGHLGGGRVMVPGTISFWLNAFTNTPELGGGFDQGLVNRVNRIAQYQIYSSDGAGDKAGEIALLWLKASGIQAVGTGGPNSKEEYKPVHRPETFRFLPEAWHEGDDMIYWVPQRSHSLAHALPREKIVRGVPINGLDVGEIREYVHSLDDVNLPPAEFHWTSRHSADIRANMQADQILSVQMTYHPGWHATANGISRRLSSDGLGQIVIEPNCSGPCQVHLVYDGGAEMLIARILSWSGLLGCLLWIVLSRRRNATLYP